MHQVLPPPHVKAPQPRKILVIGGGVAGLAALRALVEEGGVGVGKPFERVELVERRGNIGGVWYVDDELIKREKSSPEVYSGKWPVPSDVPSLSNQPAAVHAKNYLNGNTKRPRAKPSWPSPAYSGLRGNVLPRFMSLAGAPPFPPAADTNDPFPTLTETQDYLELIAAPLQSHIRCNIECISVRELPGLREGENRWAVRLRDWNCPEAVEQTEYYDAVVLTVGWTDVPSFPRIPGLEEARSLGLVDHCKWYRGPERYSKNNRIVVVGNGNSGNDVAAQLAGQRVLGEHEAIYQVARHKAWDYIVSLSDPLIRSVPALQSLTISESGDKVHVGLADGTVIDDVDKVIIACGYVVASFSYVHLLCRQPFPSEASFLPTISSDDRTWNLDDETLSTSSINTLWKPLSTLQAGVPPSKSDGPAWVPDLYWQFLHARAATLALINLCPTRIPFWTSDLQSHCLRAIWDGSMTSFPESVEERLLYQSKRLDWLAQMKQAEPDRIRTARDQCLLGPRNLGKGGYEPPEHANTPSYHSLGLMIDDFGPPLRLMAISAKPEWENKLPDWDLHAFERKNMHNLRKVALEKRRKMGVNMN